MTNRRACLLLVGGLLFATATVAVAPATATQAGAARPTDAPSVRSRHEADAPSRRSFSDVAPLFVENRGQCDARVGYSVRLRGLTAFFTADGFTYSLPGDGRTWTVAMDFAGSRADSRPEGRDLALTTMSWFRGPPSEWTTAVPTFREVAYRDVWPGIDVVFAVTGGELKYRFDVRAGADTQAIRLVVRGADDVRLDASGRLASHTPLGTIVDGAPFSWQVIDGVRVDVPTAYVLDATSPADARAFGFRVGAHDPALPLVIDPTVIVYGGFVGGDASDVATAIAVDGAKSAYVVGLTYSSSASFTTRIGPSLTAMGNGDAFVGKLSPDGKLLVYMGYIAGAGVDSASGVAVDGSGNAYVTGYTLSDETASATTGRFPVVVGPDLTHNGGYDLFVAKVNAAGTALAYCGYVGGSGTDGIGAGAVAVDGTGHACVAGSTASTQTTFPVVVGPDLTFNGGNEDAFVAKVRADGSGLDWCGYVGGSGTREAVHGVAVDGPGNVFVVGETNSTESSFPVAVGPHLTHNGPVSDGSVAQDSVARDAFVARVKADGTALDWCGYVGGGDIDYGNCIAVDSLGRACFAGHTASYEYEGFPEVGGPFLTMGGLFDGFVGRVKADGTGFDWCGFYGGNGSDRCTGIAVDPADDVYIVGITDSSAGSLPAAEFTFNTHGGDDVFVAKLASSSGAVVYAGIVGTSNSEGASGIAVDGLGHTYLTGSAGPSFPVVCGPGLAHHSPAVGADAFVLKLGDTVSTCDGGGGGGGHIDVTPTESYFLPKRVLARVNAKDAAKSKLLATGFFDMGGQPLDLTQPATVTVGSLVVPVAGFTQDGTRFRFTEGGLTVEIASNPYGSSRAKFRVLRKGDLTDVAPQDGELTLRFTNAVVTDAHSLVRMGTGKFQLGRVRGALSQPSVFVQRAKAKVVGGGKDALTLVVGLATDGTTPSDAADFAVEFGGLYAAIPAASFEKRGDRFKFQGDVNGVTSVTLDYLREQITVKAKNAALGDFAEGGNPTTIAIQLGSEGRAVTVRTVKARASLRY